ncbi:glycerol transporter [Pleurotus ostreatus]|nr:glycerol transporter [Pleurotus ostreatus]
MGGAKSVVLNSVLVFTFVALWHDLTFRLLAWGWLVSLFIIPELLASSVLPASKYDQRWWYRHVCALGAVGNMMMMMAANLVGFVIGTDGVQFFLQRLTGSIEGTRFLVLSVFCMFVAAHLMFEYREEEMRHGIYRRC